MKTPDPETVMKWLFIIFAFFALFGMLLPVSLSIWKEVLR